MILSADESNELLRLVMAKQGEHCAIDPGHALVLYALKLVVPIGGNRANGYMPTKAGLKLAKAIEASQEPSHPPALSMTPTRHRNTDPFWPFPICVRAPR